MAGVQSSFEQPDAYPVDARGVTYSFAFFSARHLGKGQFYLMTLVDSQGQPLNGNAHYRLHVPPSPPVTQYWSATLYNRETHTLISEVERAGRSSQCPGLQTNDDGSVDLYFGPAAPDGKEANWVPTDSNGRFEVLFRFYGPVPALLTCPGSFTISRRYRPDRPKFHSRRLAKYFLSRSGRIPVHVGGAA